MQRENQRPRDRLRGTPPSTSLSMHMDIPGDGRRRGAVDSHTRVHYIPFHCAPRRCAISLPWQARCPPTFVFRPLISISRYQRPTGTGCCYPLAETLAPPFSIRLSRSRWPTEYEACSRFTFSLWSRLTVPIDRRTPPPGTLELSPPGSEEDMRTRYPPALLSYIRTPFSSYLSFPF